MMLELVFPAFGQTIPTDHAYHLYAALAGVIPVFHDSATALRFAPLTGDPGGRQVAPPERAVVRVRLRVAADVAGHRVR